jgi:O-antigen chain-terminating methyltransferase
MDAADSGVRLMVAPFYRAFEDIHRGSRELILDRLAVYLPFLEPLKALDANPAAIDLGCGRGEWLELVIGAGFSASGVDLDEGMLEGCRAHGLPAEHDDAVAALKKRADGSVSVVSAFHLVEHIPFPELQVLIVEALRVLRPGGLLILETPNAENLFVGSNGFYMDPTHERPIPHLLLSFLTEFSGFKRSKLVRLQEQAALHDSEFEIDLITAMGGSSPDYAIVAQKDAEPESLALFDAPFTQNFGITPGELAARYDQRLDTRFRGLENKLEAVGSVTEKLLETDAKIESLQIKIDEAVSVTGKIVEIDTNIEGLRSQIVDATVVAEKLSEVDSNIDALQTKIEEVSHVTDKFLEMEANLEGLNVKMDEVASITDKFLENISGINKELSAAQFQNGSLGHQNSLLLERNEILEQRYTALLSENHTLAEMKAQLESALESVHQHLNQTGDRQHVLEAQLVAVLESTSWRTTRPLRHLSKVLGGGRAANRAARAAQAASAPQVSLKRRMALGAMRFVLARPFLKRSARLAMKPLPRSVKSRLWGLFVASEGHVVPHSPVEIGPSNLSQREAEIYMELKQAFERKERK